MTDINDIKQKYQVAQDALRDTERELEQAKLQKYEVEKQMLQLGIDPEGDLTAQLEERGKDLNDSIDNIIKLLDDAASDAAVTGATRDNDQS